MRRRLTSDEAELWSTVARSITPMHNRHLQLPDPVEPTTPEPQPVKQPAQSRIPAFRLGEKAAPAPAAPPSDPLRMDARTHQKMTRGKLAPEARIDLHGMTLAEAHPELIRFILNAQSDGLRLVLVITGKGKGVADPVPRPIGALRHQVPHWLRLPPLALSVQQVAEAHLKHGGSGAFYVYLRRR
ncbi:Smr/MutS family protein [Neotabrizicola sp. sgz301269]|uniref:Smr/MutS family protein n=1 Tax=Neotabrizicola sp. sgz301269 TaxID=3276282 RepID=UPI00376FD116